MKKNDSPPILFTKRSTCPFEVKCQVSDAEHCGVWCLSYLTNFCLKTLELYAEDIQKSGQNLKQFAVDLKQKVYYDIVRHGLLDAALMHFKSPNISIHSKPSLRKGSFSEPH